jgi:hypothetical protein
MPDSLQDKVMALMGKPVAAAAEPVEITPVTEQEIRDWHQWQLGGKFRVGLKPPRSTGGWDFPPAAGSASDVENSWRGSAAQEGEWK